MLQKGDRVRHIDEQLNAQYGVMEIWEIKNGHAICRHGDYFDLAVVTFSLDQLQKAG